MSRYTEHVLIFIGWFNTQCHTLRGCTDTTTLKQGEMEHIEGEGELDEADRILMAPHVRFSMTAEKKATYYAETWAASP